MARKKGKGKKKVQAVDTSLAQEETDPRVSTQMEEKVQGESKMDVSQGEETNPQPPKEVETRQEALLDKKAHGENVSEVEIGETLANIPEIRSRI